MARSGRHVSFFPKVDDAILTSNHAPPLFRPQIVGPVFDQQNVDQPISEWSCNVSKTFYPEPKPFGPSVSPDKPDGFNDRYLRAFLADNERLRLSVLWYYTHDVLNEAEFLSGLQQKAHLAQESTGWEFAVIGFLDLHVYTRLATVGLELGVLPRGETLCAHTVTQPPGNVFLLPNLMEDWRFQQCPYLEDGGLRAYAGVPLRIQTGSECVSLGSLCVASSTAQEPLSKSQHQALVHLADWIISDLVQCTRVRRQRERHRMSKLIAEVPKNQNDTGSPDSVLDILRTIYPGAIIGLRPSCATHIDLDGTYSVSIADLQDGLYEDFEYLDNHIVNSNHAALPSDRPVRILSAPCESIAGPSLLVVASKNFHLVFDDVDSWFIQTCADMISQIWKQRLLGEALKAKEKFLRAFSHGLRTPIHGILGSAELLTEELKAHGLNRNKVLTPTMMEESSKIWSAESLAYLKTIKMAGHDLRSIINNLITLNKWIDIASGERHYGIHTVTELEGELGREVAKFIKGDTRYTNSIFFIHCLSSFCASFRADLRVIQDALFPLIINAIQHTPQGTVSVIASIDTDNKKLIVDIKDTGCGIHPKFHQSIFEAYEKVNPHSAGAGLGLTLASKFASLSNGSVDLISSNAGFGSHFRAIFKLIECDCFATPPQQLPMRLSALPFKFFTIQDDQDDYSLMRPLENFLTLNGFSKSNSMEDSIIIFEATSDIEKNSEILSLIPSEQVAICLIPGSEVTHDPEHRERQNVLYLTGPFTTSALHLVLEKAHKYLIGGTSQSPLSQPSPETSPSLAKLSIQQITYPNENIQPDAEPVDLSAPAQLDIAMRSSSTSSQPFTLIVDDNTVNLRLMKAYCKKRGLPYLFAEDGLQAVETFTHHQSTCAADNQSPIELIFMDLQMPICGGIEATQQIRLLEQERKWTTSSIFVMTGQDSVADRRAADEAGADEFFVKPVVLKQLDRVIMEYFPAFAMG